jgi:hypothetical protein
MIKMQSKIWLVLVAGLSLVMINPGCSERSGKPLSLADSTWIYPSVKPDGILAKITLSRFYSQKSGKPSAISTVFALKDGENIYAVIDLENRMKQINKELLFHVDWIDPEGKSIYLKKIVLPPGDSVQVLTGSISVSPANRVPGKYSVRIYLFRELIAEKHFEFRNESDMENINANIVFFKNIDKETGEMIGADTVFEIKKKGILRARIDLSGTGIYKDEELPVRMEWYGSDGESFYSKKVEVNPADSISSFTGSISITPDKRLPGDYFLRIYLFDEMIGEKVFTLLPKD